MSTKVAGLWELSWNVPLIESSLWVFVLREFGVHEWAMSPISGITHIDSWSGELNLKEYESISDMVTQFSEGHERVFVDEYGSVPLHEFEHPENAVYFFGKVGQSPSQHKRLEDKSVRIMTKINTGVMWPHQCLATILHDRLIKCQ